MGASRGAPIFIAMNTITAKNKIYTGIGSRKTPINILKLMKRIAQTFDVLGWRLYTGGADGADTAFMSGSTNMQVFLPWKGFRQLDSLYVHDFSSPRGQQAEMAVELYHPRPDKLSIDARMLMARNTYQVTGWNHAADELSGLVVCWTADGKASGGTGQTIRIAEDLGVPIVNLHDPVNVAQYQQFVRSVIGNAAGV